MFKFSEVCVQESEIRRHVWILGLLYIVFGALGMLAALTILAIFGGSASIVSLAEQGPESALAVPIIGLVGGVIFLILAVLSVPGLVVGVGLVKYRRWARIGGVVLSAINLVNPPFGTLLGIYGLWVLLPKESEGVFV